MRGMETGKTRIRHEVFTEIARMAYEGGDYAQRLEELPYKSKVIFSSKNYSDLPSLVHFKSAEKQGHVGIDLKTYHRYFNAVTWLNKGGEDLTK